MTSSDTPTVPEDTPRGPLDLLDLPPTPTDEPAEEPTGNPFGPSTTEDY